MLYTNVRSLTSGTKREELQILIDSEKLMLLVLQKLGVMLILWTVRWISQGLNYTGKTEQP